MGLQQAGTGPFSGNRLANTLSGNAPGSPVSCLPSTHSWTSENLGGGSIAYRSGSRVYIGTFEGGCSRHGRMGYTMVTRARGMGMCQGDIAHIVDTSTGMTVGSCVVGPFIPYDLGRKWR
jgi:hypothetical protein